MQRSHANPRSPARHSFVALLKEHIMLTELAHRLGTLFTETRDRERDAYLASSTDLAELERRMRHLDDGGYPFHVHSSVMPRDWIA
jgi:hypothetical protein